MSSNNRKGRLAPLHGVAFTVVLPLIGLPTVTAGVTYDLVETGNAITRTWDSGKTNNLSNFVSIKCPENYGNERLLVAFKGFREPSANLDNFVTQLRGVCRRYGPDQGGLPYAVADNPPMDNSKLLFTADHRSPRTETEVLVGGNGDRVPMGVNLKVNTNEYVKDIKIIYKVSYNSGLGGSEQTTTALTGLKGSGSNKSVDLRCPTDYALTGTSVKYSTNNGKIRVFKIDCRRLVLR